MHTAGDPVRTHLLLRFSEFEDELIRLAANRRIFHVGGSRIASIVKQVTLALEPEARGFNFRLDRGLIDPMQCVGVAQTGAGCRSVVDDDVTSTGLQCCKDSLVDFCKVGRGEERIMKVMIIQRNPDQVQRLWRREVVDWPGDDGNVRKFWIWL